MAGLQKVQVGRVSQMPAKAPQKDLMVGRLTAVTEAFLLLYQGSMAKDSQAIRSAALELHSKAVQFARRDQLKPALEGAILNGADPTNLLRELGRLSRETGDDASVNELLDCAVDIMKTSGSVASSTSANLVKILFADAGANSRAIALEECVSMIAEEGKSLQKMASDVICGVYKYLDPNSREFVRQSLEHIEAYGVSPESFDPVPKLSSKETASALLSKLDTVPAAVIDLAVDESGIWRVV
jgi:hypothetical protein